MSVRNLDGSALSFERDKRIFFEEEGHIYKLDNETQLKPVSSLIAGFFDPFDAIKWSGIKARKLGISPEHVREKWAMKSFFASSIGTHMHAQIENHFLGNEQVLDYDFMYNGKFEHCEEKGDVSVELGYFSNFVADTPLTPFRVEWPVFDEAHLVAGTIDLACRNANGEIELYDWKRSAKLPDENKYQHGKGELCHVGDSSLHHYYLQQNMYRYILENNYGLHVAKMNLVALHPELDGYKILPVPRWEKEIEYMLRERLKELIEL